MLRMGQGESNQSVAAEVGLCAHTIGTLRKRFKQCRLEGLSDLPRSGAPRSIEDEKVRAIVEDALQRLPQGRAHWSTRQMGKAHGVSHESASSIWKAFGLKSRVARRACSSPTILIMWSRSVMRLASI